MSFATSFFKNPLLVLLSAGMICLFTGGPAISHPHGPVKLIPLDSEVAFTFEYNGEEYEVFNTHLINFIGLERIEIRDEDGNVVEIWWSRRGWCFTAAAYTAEQCMSQERYRNFFRQKLIYKTTASSANFAGGSGGSASRSSLLDNFPCLEKRLSDNKKADVELTAPDC